MELYIALKATFALRKERLEVPQGNHNPSYIAFSYRNFSWSDISMQGKVSAYYILTDSLVRL